MNLWGATEWQVLTLYKWTVWSSHFTSRIYSTKYTEYVKGVFWRILLRAKNYILKAPKWRSVKQSQGTKWKQLQNSVCGVALFCLKFWRCMCACVKVCFVANDKSLTQISEQKVWQLHDSKIASFSGCSCQFFPSICSAVPSKLVNPHRLVHLWAWCNYSSTTANPDTATTEGLLFLCLSSKAGNLFQQAPSRPPLTPAPTARGQTQAHQGPTSRRTTTQGGGWVSRHCWSAARNEEVCSICIPLRLMCRNRSWKSTGSRNKGSEELISSASFTHLSVASIFMIMCGMSIVVYFVILLTTTRIANMWTYSHCKNWSRDKGWILLTTAQFHSLPWR